MKQKLLKSDRIKVDASHGPTAGWQMALSLIIKTEGPEPVTPTFIDTAPVHVTGIEGLDLSNKLLCRVSENPTEGFNFPYYLLIPHGIDLNKSLHLLVEPNNTGVGSNFVSLDKNTKDAIETCSGSRVARKLKIPLLMPVFSATRRDTLHPCFG